MRLSVSVRGFIKLIFIIVLNFYSNLFFYRVPDAQHSLPGGEATVSQQTHHVHGRNLALEETHGNEGFERSPNDHLMNQTSRVLPLTAEVHRHESTRNRESPPQTGDFSQTYQKLKPEYAQATKSESGTTFGSGETQGNLGEGLQSLDPRRSARFKVPPWTRSASSGRNAAADARENQTQQHFKTSSKEIVDVSSSTQPGEAEGIYI